MGLWDDLRALVDSRDMEHAETVAGLTEEKSALEDVVSELEGRVRELTDRIAELEKPADPAVLPYWGAPVFRDEFAGDLTLWNVRDNFTTMDTARAMASNATVKDGRLHLRADWMPSTQKAGPKGIITHTTGYIDTRNLAAGDKHFSQEFGRWEIRCQTPTGDNTLGALAAFWLRNDNHPGEIDILESWGGATTMPSKAEYDRYVKGTGVTTFHSDTMGGGKLAKFRHSDAGIPRTVHAEMHTYGFERTPDYISVDVDGKQVFKVTPDTHAWLWDPTYFGSPLHMRLNLHVGPNATHYGLPDPNNRAATQPLDFQVEYVRVYTLPKG